MNWQQVCNDPSLHDLPYKIELNEYGNIEMSPTKNRHSIFQADILFLIKSLKNEGKVLPECSIETPKGVKVADVVWMSDGLFQQQKYDDVFGIAPEICIEILSYSNTPQEMTEKQQLYFSQGAQECWICTLEGDMEFYNTSGQIETSGLIPKFPDRVEF